MNTKSNILVAPLNWGLGHATRCIPIINALEDNGYNPIIASDGAALDILRKEFPHLTTVELPSYNIEYPENGDNFKWKILKNAPSMFDSIIKEKKLIKKLVAQYDIRGIISDNRIGVFNKKVPSVFITHQLNVLSGKTTWISSIMHQQAIRNFDECWVPDFEDAPYLSFKLGHLKNFNPDIIYIGPQSRLEIEKIPLKFDLMVLLSGPEPQRTMLDTLLRAEVKRFEGNVIYVCGQVEAQQQMTIEQNITFYNFMTGDQLQKAMNQSNMILCRSGYTTIMDIAQLGKKCFFIPTPGQYEQQYLAKKYKKEGMAPWAKQDNFKIENLLEVDLYAGLPQRESVTEWKKLFCLFKSE